MDFTPPTSLPQRDSRLLREIADESRQFWVVKRLRLAAAIIVVMLGVEVLIAAAFYAKTNGEFRRGTDNVHRVVVSFLGLSSQWAKALFVGHTLPEHADPEYDIDLRDRFQLAADVLYDLASMLRAWLLPLFAAVAFTGSGVHARAGRLWRRAAATAGPLAIIALFLILLAVLVEQVLAYLYAPAYEPGPYLSDRLRLVPWGSVGERLLINLTWLLPPFLLMPVVAAAAKERQPALAACFGTSLFLVPLLTMGALYFYPGGVEAVPSLLMLYVTPLITLLLFALTLPLARRSIGAETASGTDA